MDDELQHWIERRLLQISKEERLRSRIALFPKPPARNPKRHWITNAVREEWNRAAENPRVPEMWTRCGSTRPWGA